MPRNDSVVAAGESAPCVGVVQAKAKTNPRPFLSQRAAFEVGEGVAGGPEVLLPQESKRGGSKPPPHDPRSAAVSVSKEFLELMRRQGRIARGILNIAVTEIGLDPVQKVLARLGTVMSQGDRRAFHMRILGPCREPMKVAHGG